MQERRDIIATGQTSIELTQNEREADAGEQAQCESEQGGTHRLGSERPSGWGGPRKDAKSSRGCLGCGLVVGEALGKPPVGWVGKREADQLRADARRLMPRQGTCRARAGTHDRSRVSVRKARS